jgi:hypothetical protein
MTKHKKCQTKLYITGHLVMGQYTNSHGMIPPPRPPPSCVVFGCLVIGHATLLPAKQTSEQKSQCALSTSSTPNSKNHTRSKVFHASKVWFHKCMILSAFLNNKHKTNLICPLHRRCPSPQLLIIKQHDKTTLSLQKLPSQNKCHLHILNPKSFRRHFSKL